MYIKRILEAAFLIKQVGSYHLLFFFKDEFQNYLHIGTAKGFCLFSYLQYAHFRFCSLMLPDPPPTLCLPLKVFYVYYVPPICVLDSLYLECFTADLSPELQTSYIHPPTGALNLEV